MRKRTKAMRETVLQFALGSAAGPSGLRPQHLQDIIRNDAGTGALLIAALDRLVGQALGGRLPQTAAPISVEHGSYPWRKRGRKCQCAP